MTARQPPQGKVPKPASQRLGRWTGTAIRSLPFVQVTVPLPLSTNGKGDDMYRQGDVLLVRVADLPNEAGQPRDSKGRLVLAEGEATGHAHAILHEGARLHGSELEDRFLEVLAEGGVDLVHEEHATIRVPQGVYRVIRQREHRFEQSRAQWVQD